MFVLLCVVHLKEKKYNSENWGKSHNAAIQNEQVHHWGLEIKIYMINF